MRQTVATIRRDTVSLNLIFNIIRLRGFVLEYVDNKTDAQF